MSSDGERKNGGRGEGDERRKHPRYEWAEMGKLWLQGTPFACTLIHVSAGGALVETSHPAFAGMPVELEVFGLGRRSGQIVHTDGAKIGLRFDSEIDFDPEALVR
jgi:hypothetical protein